MANQQRNDDKDTVQVMKEYAGTGVFWRFVGFFVLAAAIIIALAQNVDDVRFEWIVWDIEAPFAVFLLITALVAAFATELSAAIWRRSRRRVRTERQELGRLRSERERQREREHSGV